MTVNVKKKLEGYDGFTAIMFIVTKICIIQDSRLHVDLTDQGVANLSILDLKRSDEGDYTCAGRFLIGA